MDEGWAVNLKADLFQVVPEIDLKELVAYADSKHVGLILGLVIMLLNVIWKELQTLFGIGY